MNYKDIELITRVLRNQSQNAEPENQELITAIIEEFAEEIGRVTANFKPANFVKNCE